MKSHELKKRIAKRRQRGVTLIELLVVLAILALISAIVVINILPERDRAAVRKAEIDIRTIETALLWTRSCTLMHLPQQLVNAAMQNVHAA